MKMKMRIFTDTNHIAHNKWNLLGGPYCRALTTEYNAEKQKNMACGDLKYTARELKKLN